jgi:GDP-D-mannose dehydratase
MIFPYWYVENIYFNGSKLVALRQKIYLFYLSFLSKFGNRRIENTNVEVIGQARREFYNGKIDKNFYGYLMDMDFVLQLIKILKPEIVFHLTSHGNVTNSWIEPKNMYKNNVNNFLNVIDAVRNVSKNYRAISIGLAEEYGGSLNNEPFSEISSLIPNSPYADANVA